MHIKLSHTTLALTLYWVEKRLFTYWFMSDVFPTPESPRMMTFSRTFLRDAMRMVKGYKPVVQVRRVEEMRL